MYEFEVTEEKINTNIENIENTNILRYLEA